MALLPFSFLIDDSLPENDGKGTKVDDQSSRQPETKGDPAAIAPLDAMTHRLQQRSMPAQHMGAAARRVLSTLLQWAATTDTLSGRSTHGRHVLLRWSLSVLAYAYVSFDCGLSQHS